MQHALGLYQHAVQCVGHMKQPQCAKEVCNGGDENGNDDGRAAESEQ